MNTETATTAATATQYKTRIEKGRYDKQWSAVTYIDLLHTNKQLRVSTHKSGRGILYTSCHGVTIQHAKDNSAGFSGETWAIGSDYDKNIMQHPEVSRVTDKAIAICHNKALANIKPYVTEANEFYNNKG